MHHAEILFVHMFRDNLVIYPFLTNLEDEISVKGGRICNTSKSHFENLVKFSKDFELEYFLKKLLKSYPLK